MWLVLRGPAVLVRMIATLILPAVIAVWRQSGVAIFCKYVMPARKSPV
jgi:hypothetical protein